MDKEKALKIWLPVIADGVKKLPECKESLEMAITALENQKTGHWITKEGKEQGYDIAGVKTWYIQIMCNECGFIKTAIEGHTGQYHYCPNCGAKMEGE